MNEFLKKISLSFALFLLCTTITLAQSRTYTVTGSVIDEQHQPLIGVVVLEKGTTNGTTTDFDGKFTINVESAESMLEISYLGFVSQILETSATKTPIVLKEDVVALDGVVVIGYGSVKKEDLSGSVVAIKAEEMNRGAVTSPQELLQGKVPGLSVVQGSGEPGSGSTIRIRSGASLNASNDPLIVIDGIPVSNDAAPGTSNALATINPNDIETFTVLKDASATAIYGSRASNGVIIITTKKGSKGNLKVSYSSTYSLNHAYKRVDVMTADEFRKTITEQYKGSAQSDEVSKLLNKYPNQSTDWQDEIFQLGLATDQNIAISGKTGFLPFRVSLGYHNERGTLKTSNYARYTGAVNLSPKFFDEHLSVDVNLKGTITDQRFADGSTIGSAIYYDPTKPIYSNDADGYNGYYNHTVNGQPNTLSNVNPLTLLYDRHNSGITKRSLGNIQLDYKIHGLEDLRANLNLGYDIAKSEGDDYVNPSSFQAARDTDFTKIGRGKSWDNKRENKLLDFYLNYSKELNEKNRFDLMAGYSWQNFYSSDYNSNWSNAMTSAGDKEGWSYKDDRYFSTDDYPKPKENYLVSFFGRANYSYDNRYLITATLRQDGSSRFSDDNRWGLFPSVAAAWTITNEEFMSGTSDILSSLKLRLGYGITGQQEIEDYLYIQSYINSSNSNSQYFDDLLMRPDGYSPNLKWEETTTYNIALDYGFLSNRIKGSIEYYQKNTDDLLNTVSAAAGTNFSNQIVANVGSMKNKGLEFNIDGVAIQSEDFTWNLGYNVTWNSSKITKLTTSYNPDYEGIAVGYAPYGTGVVLSRHQVGATPFNFWLLQQVYDKYGNPIQDAFVDRNNDGQITDADRYLTNKSPLPDFYMGLSSQFVYKNWDLGFNLRANLGSYAFNASYADNSTLKNYSGLSSLSNYNHDAITYTGFTETATIDQKCSDLFLENTSFLKMDNITLGYSFSKIFNAKVTGRLNFSVQNVFTITNYSGIDPELPGVNGIDTVIWPRSRTYTLGINFNL